MQTSVKHRLVFSFYLTDDYRENEIYNLHFKLLERYSNIFDESIFGIIIDNEENQNLIENFEKDIIKLGFINVTFHLYKNTAYREAIVFKNEIVDRLSELDGLTFFGHSKGYTNKKDEYLKYLVCGLYYLSLENIKDVDKNCIEGIYNGQSYFYGSFLQESNDLVNKFNCHYSGTFFWINTQALNEYISIRNIELPQIHNRQYAEAFPGNLFKLFDKKEIHLASYKSLALLSLKEFSTIGPTIINCLKGILGVEEYENKFLKLYEKL